VGVALVAGAVLAVGLLRPEPVGVTPSDASPEPAVRAAALGIDLTNGSPDQDRERLVGLFEAGARTPLDAVVFRNGAHAAPQTNALFSGYLADAFEDGSSRRSTGARRGPRSISCWSSSTTDRCASA
jgi:hypothetical protein